MKPLPLLALACALVTPSWAVAPRAQTPAQRDAAYMAGPWVEVDFTGPDGKPLQLWANQQQSDQTSFSWYHFVPDGTAPLFYFTRLPPTPGHVNFSSAPTDYVLRVTAGGMTVTKNGNTTWSTSAYYMPGMMALGDSYVVTRGGPAMPASGPAPAPAPGSAASGLLAVVPGPKDAADKAALTKACPKGMVVVKGADVNPAALATSQPALYCGNKDAGDKPVLAALGGHKLTVTSQAGHQIVRLDDGPYNASDPDSQLKLQPIAASALPAGDGGGTNPPGPKPNPAPNPSPRPGPNGGGAFALTGHEKNWLALDEYISYRDQHAKIENAKPAPKDKHAQLVKLYATFRDKIQKNVPPASAAGYTAERQKSPTSTTAAAISAYVKELDGKAAGYQYAAADIALSSDEQATAKKAASASGAASKTLLDDYNAERAQDAQTVTSGETADHGTPHDDTTLAAKRTDILYFRTTTKYRALIGGNSPTPTPGNTGPWPALDARLKPYFNGSGWDNYSSKDDELRRQYAKAVHDGTASPSQLAALIKQINDNEKAALGVLAHDLTKNKVDAATINQNVIALLTPDQHSYMCDAIVKAEANAPSGPPAAEINNGADAIDGAQASANTNINLKGQIKAQKEQAAKDKAAQTGGPATPPAPAPAADPSKITTTSPVYQACTGAAGPTPPAPGGGVVTPVTPGGSTSDLATAPPGVPEGDSSENPNKAKPDPNNMSHVRAGLGGALIGLVFGTFFGPVGVLVGAAIGFGAGYATDKYLMTGSS